MTIALQGEDESICIADDIGIALYMSKGVFNLKTWRVQALLDGAVGEQLYFICADTCDKAGRMLDAFLRSNYKYNRRGPVPYSSQRVA